MKHDTVEQLNSLLKKFAEDPDFYTNNPAQLFKEHSINVVFAFLLHTSSTSRFKMWFMDPTEYTEDFLSYLKEKGFNEQHIGITLEDKDDKRKIDAAVSMELDKMEQEMSFHIMPYEENKARLLYILHRLLYNAMTVFHLYRRNIGVGQTMRFTINQYKKEAHDTYSFDIEAKKENIDFGPTIH